MDYFTEGDIMNESSGIKTKSGQQQVYNNASINNKTMHFYNKQINSK